MRHRKNFNHLSRKAGHRKAMLANMANSLIIHKRIETTTAKAKALRTYVEPLITKSKDDSTHSRRVAFSYLQNKDAVNELFREISTKVATRPGGYTRILKTGYRTGDNADMCIIELVDYNENLLAAAEESKAKEKTGKRRRRRGKGKGSQADEQQSQAQEASKTVDSGEDMASPEETLEETTEVQQEGAVEEATAAEEEQQDVESKESAPTDAEVKEEEEEDKKEGGSKPTQGKIDGPESNQPGEVKEDKKENKDEGEKKDKED